MSAYWIALEARRLSTEDGPAKGGRISRGRGGGGTQSAGEGRYGTCGFRRTQLGGGATGFRRLVRRRRAGRTRKLGLMGEMAAGGAGARGADRECLSPPF